MKTTRTKQGILNHPAVNDFYFEDDSYWIHLKSGWIQPDMECGLIHERTITECCTKLNSSINTKS